MALLALVFDSSTGRLLAQKVGSDQIGNGAVLSAHIGAAVIGGAHLNTNDVWPGRTFSGQIIFTPTSPTPQIDITMQSGNHAAINLAVKDDQFAPSLKLQRLEGTYSGTGFVMTMEPNAPYFSIQSIFNYGTVFKLFDDGSIQALRSGHIATAGRVQGVLISSHVHTGGANDAPQIASGGITAGAVGNAHLVSGEIDAANIKSGTILAHPKIAYVLLVSGEQALGDYEPPVILRSIIEAATLKGALEVRSLGNAKTLTIASGSIPGLPASKITTGTFTSARIAANIIATPHIKNQGILSASIGVQIGAAHLFTPPFTSGYVIIGQGSGVTPVYGGVPAGTPGDNTITSAKIASGQVGDGHIYPGSVISAKIGANIIATTHIKNQGILSASIGASVIGGIHILAGSIAGVDIANQGILSANYGANLIATPHIKNQGILSASFDANVIAAPHIRNQGILSANIGAAVLAGVHIYSGSIAGANLANQLITSSKIGANVIGPPLFQRFASGQIMKGQGTGANAIYKDEMAAIAFVIDGFGSSIQSGNKGYLQIPFPCTLNSVTMLAPQSGQIDVHIWKDTYANYPPTSSDTICSSFLPRISGSFKYQETSLSGWNRGIASGDILDFVVTPTASSIQLCTVSLGVYR